MRRRSVPNVEKRQLRLKLVRQLFTGALGCGATMPLAKQLELAEKAERAQAKSARLGNRPPSPAYPALDCGAHLAIVTHRQENATNGNRPTPLDGLGNGIPFPNLPFS
jgi:hypothetical protein